MGEEGLCEAPSGEAFATSGSNCQKSTTSTYTILSCVAAVPLIPFVFIWLWSAIGRSIGWYLTRKTEGRRAHILEIMEEDEERYKTKTAKAAEPGTTGGGEDGWENIESYTVGSADNGRKGSKEWDGIIGFLHPFCNAGGGGERVLWAAIRATQQRWPKAKCIVYTGDHDVNKEAMLSRVKSRFNIHLHPPTVQFLYLSSRHWVLASTWPRFTLAGQSFGSILMAWDAFSLLVPDVFIDTMGYAFALGLCRFLFRHMPTAAYVHYPTISTDMLESLDPNSIVGTQGVNAGKGTGFRGRVKRRYWQTFAAFYRQMGACVDVVMTNSSWTQGHMEKLWGGSFIKKVGRSDGIAVVYPPVAVRELEEEVEVSAASEKVRENVLLYIAQFRPEKNHQLIIQSFAEFVKKSPRVAGAEGARLVLVGSVRDDHDKKRVYKLRLLVNELHIKERVVFHLDASWPEILDWLRKAYVGVNGMWNEHFGIGVVEYQAAGLISVVHDSGGPKLDIVTNIDGQPTGFHATTSTEFAEAFSKALSLPDPLAMRERARRSAKRFTEEEFARGWIEQMLKVIPKQ